MNLNEYMAAAMRTNAPGFDATRVDPELMHAVMGMVTEAGELLDALKKVTAYNKKLDLTNLDEELGDILWYVALFATARTKIINADIFNGASFMTPDVYIETVMRRNIAKLTKRFPEKFTEEAAANRDLSAERAILEGRQG